MLRRSVNILPGVIPGAALVAMQHVHGCDEGSLNDRERRAPSPSLLPPTQKTASRYSYGRAASWLGEWARNRLYEGAELLPASPPSTVNRS